MRLHKITEHAQTEWTAHIALDPKKDESLCFCVNYRNMTAPTKQDFYRIPLMDECTNFLGKATERYILDADSCEWHAVPEEADRDKTTFMSRHELFRLLRVPSGLKNTLETPQQATKVKLSPVKWQLPLVYLDNSVVFLHSPRDHISNVKHVLSLVQDARVIPKLKPLASLQSKLTALAPSYACNASW